MGLLTAAESGLRREANKLAEGYLRPPGDIGLVVGLLVRDECLCLGYGKVANDLARPPDAGTVSEIGSITKVFTAALLAEMAGRGEVRLDQPVAELLPAGFAHRPTAGRRSPWPTWPSTPRRCPDCRVTSGPPSRTRRTPTATTRSPTCTST